MCNGRACDTPGGVVRADGGCFVNLYRYRAETDEAGIWRDWIEPCLLDVEAMREEGLSGPVVLPVAVGQDDGSTGAVERVCFLLCSADGRIFRRAGSTFVPVAVDFVPIPQLADITDFTGTGATLDAVYRRFPGRYRLKGRSGAELYLTDTYRGLDYRYQVGKDQDGQRLERSERAPPLGSP